MLYICIARIPNYRPTILHYPYNLIPGVEGLLATLGHHSMSIGETIVYAVRLLHNWCPFTLALAQDMSYTIPCQGESPKARWQNPQDRSSNHPLTDWGKRQGRRLVGRYED